MNRVQNAIVTSLCLSACVGDSAALYVKNTVIWPGVIPVCWENPNVGTNDDAPRAAVQDAVERGWGAWANVRFSGWGTCQSNASGIRIQIKKALTFSGTRFYGNELNGIANGMVLAFLGGRCPDNPPYHLDCIRENALHEFGHALGFAHEQNRADTPSSCTSAPQGENGNETVGLWDADSIMNYCAWPDRSHLSPIDIWGVQKMYGRKPAGSVVGPNGRCLDVAGMATASGSPTQLWDCNNTSNQLWSYQAAGNDDHLVGSGSGRCLGEDGKIHDCNASDSSQAFTPVGVASDRGSVVGHGGKCLDLTGGNLSNGTRPQMYDCLNNYNQQWGWDFRNSRILTKALTKFKCLDVQGGSSVNGTAVQIYDCLGNVNQSWVWSNGEIRTAVAANKCLDVVGYGTTNGTKLQIWDCTGAPNQKFSFRSNDQLNYGSETPVCLVADGASNGSSVHTTTCDPSSANQVWTIYPGEPWKGDLAQVQWWTTVGSAGTVDEADGSNVIFDGPAVTVRPKTDVNVRYNVTPTPSNHAASPGCFDLSLRVRYRDEFNQPAPTAGHPVPLYGPDRVVVTLFQQSVFGDTITKLIEFNSDSVAANNGFQTRIAGAAAPLPHLDFVGNAYWIEAWLDLSVNSDGLQPIPPPGQRPAISAIQLIRECIN